jgi:hypothetical protein
MPSSYHSKAQKYLTFPVGKAFFKLNRPPDFDFQTSGVDDQGGANIASVLALS